MLTIAPRPCAAHAAEHLLAQQPRCLDVELERLLQEVEVDLLELLVRSHRGDVHQDVDRRAQRGFRARDERVAPAVGVGQVAHEHRAFAADGFDRRHRLHELVLGAGADRDLRALGRQPDRGASAGATLTGAGDEGDASCTRAGHGPDATPIRPTSARVPSRATRRRRAVVRRRARPCERHPVDRAGRRDDGDDVARAGQVDEVRATRRPPSDGSPTGSTNCDS